MSEGKTKRGRERASERMNTCADNLLNTALNLKKTTLCAREHVVQIKTKTNATTTITKNSENLREIHSMMQLVVAQTNNAHWTVPIVGMRAVHQSQWGHFSDFHNHRCLVSMVHWSPTFAIHAMDLYWWNIAGHWTMVCMLIADKSDCSRGEIEKKRTEKLINELIIWIEA